jgi:nucleolar protein 16
MVNPRQRKKQKSRVLIRPNRKQAKKNLVRDRLSVNNKIVEKYWDHEKTLKENFSALGLVADPNADALKTRKSKVLKDRASAAAGGAQQLEEDTAPVEPTPVILDLEERARQLNVAYKAYASTGECQFCKALIDKYDDNYEAMARDMKINVYQHPAGLLRRKIVKYHKTIDALRKQMAEAEAAGRSMEV